MAEPKLERQGKAWKVVRCWARAAAERALGHRRNTVEGGKDERLAEIAFDLSVSSGRCSAEHRLGSPKRLADRLRWPHTKATVEYG